MLKWLTFRSSADALRDVLVIGGGHAGCEAAAAAARMGARTMLLTHRLDTIGEMACNPSFGGIGKGHLIRDIDALDGVCARICDLSGTAYMILNRSKGPAVWGHRAHIDRKLYKKHMQRELLCNTPNLTVQAGSVEDLLLEEVECPESGKKKFGVRGVLLESGQSLLARTVVLTAGTFLRGRMWVGGKWEEGGRIGERASKGLSDTIHRLGFRLGRLRTGTPPRLKKSTIDFSSLEVQSPDDPPVPFSFMNESVWLRAEDQIPSHLSHTNERVGQIILENLHTSELIMEETSGPRYCPSLEAKYLRFSRPDHPVWLEPEGFDSPLIYPQGLGLSISKDIQQQVVNAVPGLEKAEIVQAGYGVQYDFMDPTQLRTSLETRLVENLFFAGQINGTTGYEEAAAQGIVAGINAAAKVQQKQPLLLERTNSYIGVLIDDLTTLGTNEPYRMFTSRAEFRLYLRPDNADVRLTGLGFEMGVVSTERHSLFLDVQRRSQELRHRLVTVEKLHDEWHCLLPEVYMSAATPEKRRTALDMLVKFNVRLRRLAEVCGAELGSVLEFLDGEIGRNTVEDRVRLEEFYREPALEMAEAMERVHKEARMSLPDNIDYLNIKNLSLECREKLNQQQPQTLGAASRIPGMTPAALVELMRFVSRCSIQSV